MNVDYQKFIESKAISSHECGFDPICDNSSLYEWQRDIVRWACKRGRSCIFADCGLGKTLMQLCWADNVSKHTNKMVLILAPLSVSAQTQREGHKFGILSNIAHDVGDLKPGINITNYEKLHHFDPSVFGGVVLDESSILKAYTGKFRTKIIEDFSDTPYRLACTATPAPNDYMELGNHSEFVGAMLRTEMLSMFFVHDGGETQKWRIKGHAQDKFWEWVCSWAVNIRKPSDLGYENNGFDLPPINFIEHIVEIGDKCGQDTLFRIPANTLQERRDERRASIHDRCELTAEIANSHDRPFIAWCDLNAESALLTKMINGAVEVKGSDSNEYKEKSLLGFSDGSIRCIVTKPTIAGFGMNWQHCSDMAFTGLSDSYEQFYQATRRCWRFGQKNPVNVHIVIASTEGAVLANIKRKNDDADAMSESMVKHMAVYSEQIIHGTRREITSYLPQEKIRLPRFVA